MVFGVCVGCLRLEHDRLLLVFSLASSLSLLSLFIRPLSYVRAGAFLVPRLGAYVCRCIAVSGGDVFIASSVASTVEHVRPALGGENGVVVQWCVIYRFVRRYSSRSTAEIINKERRTYLRCQDNFHSHNVAQRIFSIYC